MMEVIRFIKGKVRYILKSHSLRSFQVGVALLVAIVISSFAFSFAAHAQNATNTLKVSPIRTDIQIAAGQSGAVKIVVTNLTTKSIQVRPYENDFISGDENGTPSIILDQNEYAPTHSLKRFMVPLEDITIPAGESKVVEVKINVPATAQAGGYFGAIRFGPVMPDSGGQVNADASVASLILLTVPGDAVERLNLTHFDITQGDRAATDFRTPNNLKVAVRFENKGNVQQGPFGKISVKQGSKIIYSTDFNNKNPKDVILPDSARKWEVPLENIGDFGHYTVSATFTYGTKNQSIDISRSFWVIPMWAIVSAIIIVVLLIGAVVFIIMRIKGNRQRIARKRSAGRLR